MQNGVKVTIIILLGFVVIEHGYSLCPKKCVCELTTSSEYHYIISENYYYSVQINCSNTSLIDVMTDNFSADTSVLDLSFNYLNTIRKAYFENTKTLEILFLQSNIITEIELDAFTEIDKLKWLDLSNNKITNLHPQTFRNNTQLSILYLSYNMFKHPSDSSIISLPYIPATYIHRLHFVSCNISRFSEQDFMKNIHNVRNLDLSLNKLETLNLNTFSDVGELILRSNNRTLSLICNITSSSIALKLIDLSGSPLNLLECHSLPKAHNLWTINLSSCNLTEIPPRFFEQVKFVEEVKLSNNNLKVLDVSTFRSLESLRVLYLDNNVITRVDPEAVADISFLWKLILNNNPITLPSDGSFLMNWHLSVLDLHSCSLLHLTSKTFQHMTTLTMIDLSNNHLRTISKDIFNYLQELNTLNVSFNNITSIERNSFLHNVKLHFLSLAGNPIILPSDGVFVSAPQLWWLDLYSCNFSHIPQNVFSHSLQLRHIDISRNNLRYVNASLFKNLKHLENINMIENPFFCSYELRPMWLHCLDNDINCTASCAYPKGSWNILEDVTILKNNTGHVSVHTQPSTWLSSPVPPARKGIAGTVVVMLAIGTFIGLIIGLVLSYLWLDKYLRQAQEEECEFQYESVSDSTQYDLEEMSLED
ncbi:carboxypeptidase N subunit 2 [Anabrus simplex]|uniref:carboxypeptidase N subunit 2 n=1 Tax=Anabrus simplex TaxID=316456 RepID=UPI0035A3056D